ncbi:hypothetical protein D9611_010459 [Ephemerocybe angulata]|uniref:Uncharacterized protein n=1 Tax=Ephemerocybe angulata TaxID=980116 RepID=A0A8H5BUX7_9AGAR|nr:hypothetical protein D9611_010459 [Tulosesus angulatus]
MVEAALPLLQQGVPTAYFPSSDLCDLKSKFGPNNIVINYFVNNNPDAFKNAFFDFKALRVYKPSRLHGRHHNAPTVF